LKQFDLSNVVGYRNGKTHHAVASKTEGALLRTMKSGADVTARCVSPIKEPSGDR